MAHLGHAALLVSSEYLATTHAVHTLLAKPYPAIHLVGTQSFAWSRPPADVIVVLSSPAVATVEHALQLACVCWSWYHTTGHDLHTLLLVWSENFPAVHAVHTLLENPYPFTHFVGTQSSVWSRPPALVIVVLSSPSAIWTEHVLQRPLLV